MLNLCPAHVQPSLNAGMTTHERFCRHFCLCWIFRQQTGSCGGMSVTVGGASGVFEGCAEELTALEPGEGEHLPVTGGERALGCWKGVAGSFGLQGPADFARAAGSVVKETGAAL